jgi:hypothetical protein
MLVTASVWPRRVKFSKEVADRLKGGEIEFPGGLAAILSTANNGGGTAVSPDGKYVAITQGTEIRIWDLASGMLVFTGEFSLSRSTAHERSSCGVLVLSAVSTETES